MSPLAAWYGKRAKENKTTKAARGLILFNKNARIFLLFNIANKKTRSSGNFGADSDMHTCLPRLSSLRLKPVRVPAKRADWQDWSVKSIFFLLEKFVDIMQGWSSDLSLLFKRATYRSGTV